MNDIDQSAGATPAAGGATPPQTPPATPPAATPPPAAPTPPATGDDAALGEGGKRALEAERTARRDADTARAALQTELDELKAKGLSDSERAVKDAEKAGETRAAEKFQTVIRKSEVKAALAAAGINASVMDLAVGASEFAALKVGDDGSVEGLDEAVKTFKAARKDLFTKPGTDGTADGGARSTTPGKADNLEDAVQAHYNT